MCTVQVLYKTVNHGQIFLTFEGYSDYLILRFAHFIFVFTLTRWLCFDLDGFERNLVEQ